MARAERHFDSLHIPSICRLSFLTSTQSPPRLLKYSLNFTEEKNDTQKLCDLAKFTELEHSGEVPPSTSHTLDHFPLPSAS